MPELELPDRHYLLGAVGWLELGNPTEAALELERISPPNRQFPDVLEVHWEICAAMKDWQHGLHYADVLVERHPDRSSGWLHRAYALRRVREGGLGRAWDALRPAYDKFPKVPIIAYNLACYAAQMNRLDEAWEWLEKALQAGDPNRIREMALADSDLEPIWERVRVLPIADKP